MSNMTYLNFPLNSQSNHRVEPTGTVLWHNPQHPAAAAHAEVVGADNKVTTAFGRC